jgi:hypothetical protein
MIEMNRFIVRGLVGVAVERNVCRKCGQRRVPLWPFAEVAAAFQFLLSYCSRDATDRQALQDAS